MEKRAISTIVATVLIVLVTVASVSILWVAVLPLIQQVSFVENPNVQIQIDPSEYTAYDPDNNLLTVRVKRSADDADIVGLKFILDDSGNTVSHKTYDVLSPNSGKVYSFSTVGIATVNSISVSPIYDVGGSEKESAMINTFSKLPNQDLIGRAEDAAFFDSKLFIEKGESYNGLVAYYPFEEDGSDYTGHGNNCALSIPTTGNEFGEGYLNLDGTSHLMCGYDTMLDLDELSISILIKTDSPGNSYRGIVMKRRNYNLYLNDGLLGFFDDLSGGSWEPATPPLDLSDGLWHHVVLTSNSGGNPTKLYVDGNLVYTGDFTQLSDVSYPLYIGMGQGGTTQRFSGLIDEVMIFNSVLTLEEIQGIYG